VTKNPWKALALVHLQALKEILKKLLKKEKENIKK
jgi:hypothetical protein